MTNEEKQLLLKDLCARLPYRVICDMWFEGNESDKITEVLKCGGLMRLMNSEFNFIVKPYLRPMSSITEEERFDYVANTKEELGCIPELPIQPRAKSTDWLNSHHFDYRGLIEMGLALGAPEDMYKTKE